MDTEIYSYDNDYIQKIEKIEFNVWTNDDIARGSSIGGETQGIDIPDLYDNQEPKRGGLIDPRMGTTDDAIDCATCGLNNIYCVGHFGHITLAEPVFHMGFLAFIKKILSCVCTRCSKLLVYRNEKEIAEMLKNKSGKARLAEIRNIVKNVQYCQKANFGCGAIVSKIRSEIKKSTGAITLYSETSTANLPKEEGGTGEAGRKKTRQTLTPDLVFDILKNISDTDCFIMGIDPTKSRPEHMIHKILPVPPVAVRPSVKAEFVGSGTMEDDLTHKLADIIKANIRIARHKESESSAKFGQDHLHLLQYHIAFYQDSDLNIPKSEQKGKITRSLGPRLKGKDGRIRGNLEGKRIDYSGRTVITSDPTISINQLGVPVKMAMNLTFPEVVTPQNIEFLSKLVRNGRDSYPGANFIFPISTLIPGQRVLPIDLRFRKEKVELRFGDIVERHLMDDDIVLLNRQPTLHKQSMMGHRVKVINNPNLNTLRLSVAVTTPYNADFDGDEMNIFLPQSIQAQIELEEIADVKRQIITPATSRTIIGIVQDGLIGSYNLTSPNMRIDWKSAMNIMSYTSIDNFKSFKKNTEYTGHELFSMIIPPKINVVRGEGDRQVVIKNGNFEKGHLTKELLGSKRKNNLTQLIWDEYGVESARAFLDNTQRLVNNFNLWNGFTVGVGDASISLDIEEQIHRLFETKDMKVEHMITELENNPELMDIDLFERTLFAELNIIREDVSKLLMNILSPSNNFNIMISSGSKGEPINMALMSGCVGLQAFEGKLIPKKLNRRTLPYFFRDDDQSSSRGLIKRPFLRGITFPEFFFLCMTGREGLIDQAIKSVTGDTAIVVLENGKSKKVLIGDWIDEKLKNNHHRVEHYTEREMELLKINEPIYIPTCDEKGRVSWGKITAVTRHDPGHELYQITTRSGRKVIVTESKSLLIWNNLEQRFVMTSTPQVKIGDFVPVTMKLGDPPVNYMPIKIDNNDNDNNNNNNNVFEFNEINGFLIGLLIAGCRITVDNACGGGIRVSDQNVNIEEFVLKWFRNRDANIWLSFLTEFLKSDTTTQKIPDIIYAAPNDFIEGVINGYVAIYDRDDDDDEEGIQMLYSRLGVFYNQSTPKIQENVVLDDIVEIRPIDVASYPKVYDLTVPATLNFGLANGLHVVDTAESGYIQRKLVKSMEDAMIRYDGTVRTASNAIIQFTYGDSGADTTRQYEYNMKLIEMNNQDIKQRHIFTRDELANISDYTEEDNDKYYNQLIEMRDMLRTSQIKTRMNYITMSTIYMLPINLNRIIENSRNDIELQRSKKEVVNPKYVLNKIDEILDNDNTQLVTMSKNNMKNRKSIKNQDDRIAKTALFVALNDALSPKRCIIEYQLNKTQFDSIVSEIIENYNKNLAEAGEMVGVIAAQSLGEPTTQLSSFRTSKIRICGALKYSGEIGKFVDDLLEKNRGSVKILKDANHLGFESSELKLENDYYVASVSKNEKIEWKRISHVSRHPANGKMIKVTTKSGKQTTATLSHSFLTRHNNEIIPIKGEDLQIGNRIPIAKYIPVISNPIREVEIDGTKIELDREFGYFCGSYLADGSLKGNTIRISKMAQEVEVQLRKICEKYGCELTITNSKNTIIMKNYPRKYDDRLYDGKDMTFTNKPIKKFLERYFDCGSYDKKIDGMIYSANKQFIAGLISGYFDGDGNIQFDARHQGIRAHSVNEQLINDMCVLVNYIGMHATKAEENQKEQKAYRSQGIYHVIHIPIKYAEKFKYEIGLIIKAKADKLDQLIAYNNRNNKHSCREDIDMIPGLANTISAISEKLKMDGNSRTYKRFKNKEAIGRETLGKIIVAFSKEIDTQSYNNGLGVDEYIEANNRQLEMNRDKQANRTKKNIEDIKIRQKNVLKTLNDNEQRKINEKLQILKDAYNSDVVWDEIVNLEILNDPEDYVYDFTVPGLESFMVDTGILVHNTLNSVDWDEKLLIHDKSKNMYHVTEIGRLIDELIENPKTIKIKDNIEDIKENERSDTSYLDIKDNQLYVQSVTENGKIVWKMIEAITKHLPVNKDGTNTLLKVKTKSGRIVKATKAKSFLTRHDNKIIPIRGDELKIGTMIPIIMKSSNDKYDEYIDIKNDIFSKIELDNCFGFYIGAFLAHGGYLTETHIYISNNNNNKKYYKRVIEFCNKYKIPYNNNKSKIAQQLSINSAILSTLTKIWCGGESANDRKVPDFAYNAKEDFLNGFFDGYFCNVSTIKNGMSITSDSIQLLEGISLLLTRFNILSKIDTDAEEQNILLITTEYYDKIPGNNLKCIDQLNNIQNGVIPINNLRELLINNFELIDEKEVTILNDILNSDVYYDEIVEIIEVQPIKRHVYDLTVKDTLTFCLLNGLCLQDSFHLSGIAAVSTTTQGVPRIKELLSLTKNLKTPQMIIYPSKEYMSSRDMANKVASYIKYTTIGHIQDRLNVHYDPEPYKKGGFIEQDNIGSPFTTKSVSKYSCQGDPSALPWLMRIEFNRESLFEKEVKLLDIKSKFCNAWDKMRVDKSLKKEEKYVLDKISQITIASNTDYDKIPIIHLRFDIVEFDIKILKDFINYIINKFKLKGIPAITNISAINEERVLSFDNENNDIEKKKQYVTYTMGTNLYDIRYLNGIDINKTITNDVIAMYETFGIEAARATLLREIIYAYERAGSGVNYHHVSVLIDLMTFNGYMTSVDRHGMNKSDVGPLSRASFEKTVDQLQTAAVFGEIDQMNGVSSSIMAGLVIKGGTGLCNVLLDTDMIQNSEFTEDIGQKYVKTYNDISGSNIMSDIINRPSEEDNNMFIPL